MLEGKDYGDDIDFMVEEEGVLIMGIKFRCVYYSMDEMLELRVCFVLNDIVKFDFVNELIEEVEEYGWGGLVLNSDDEFGEEDGEEEEGFKKMVKKLYDFEGLDLVWIFEMLLKFGVFLIVEDWEMKKWKKIMKLVMKKLVMKKLVKVKGGM